MKCLIVVIIAVFAFVAASEKWKPPSASAPEIHEKCVEASGVTTEQKAKLSKLELADEKEVHEYILCMVKKLRIFTEEQGFKADQIRSVFNTTIINEEKAQEILGKCIDNNEQKSTPAEWAYRGVECVLSYPIDEPKDQKKLENNNKSNEV